MVRLTLHDNNFNVFITHLFTCGYVPNTWISSEYSTRVWLDCRISHLQYNSTDVKTSLRVTPVTPGILHSVTSLYSQQNHKTPWWLKLSLRLHLTGLQVCADSFQTTANFFQKLSNVSTHCNVNICPRSFQFFFLRFGTINSSVVF